jgi:hypothetical protein
VIQGVYPAYISHETFLTNRSKLKANRYNFDVKGRGAARDGAQRSCCRVSCIAGGAAVR